MFFHTIAAAPRSGKAFNWWLSVGNTLDPEQIGPVPSNAIIVKHATALELLKQASVCVTHAGLNTVLEAWPKRAAGRDPVAMINLVSPP